MNEYTQYLIAVGAVLVSILTIYFSVKIYKKKKRALEAEIEIAHENLRRKEIETQNKLNQMEQSANDRIRAAENERQRMSCTEGLKNLMVEWINLIRNRSYEKV